MNPFDNNVPSLSSSDRIRNKRDKVLYQSAKKKFKLTRSCGNRNLRYYKTGAVRSVGSYKTQKSLARGNALCEADNNNGLLCKIYNKTPGSVVSKVTMGTSLYSAYNGGGRVVTAASEPEPIWGQSAAFPVIESDVSGSWDPSSNAPKHDISLCGVSGDIVCPKGYAYNVMRIPRNLNGDKVVIDPSNILFPDTQCNPFRYMKHVDNKLFVKITGAFIFQFVGGWATAEGTGQIYGVPAGQNPVDASNCYWWYNAYPACPPYSTTFWNNGGAGRVIPTGRGQFWLGCGDIEVTDSRFYSCPNIDIPTITRTSDQIKKALIGTWVQLTTLKDGLSTDGRQRTSIFTGVIRDICCYNNCCWISSGYKYDTFYYDFGGNCGTTRGGMSPLNNTTTLVIEVNQTWDGPLPQGGMTGLPAFLQKGRGNWCGFEGPWNSPEVDASGGLMLLINGTRVTPIVAPPGGVACTQTAATDQIWGWAETWSSQAAQDVQTALHNYEVSQNTLWGFEWLQGDCNSGKNLTANNQSRQSYLAGIEDGTKKINFLHVKQPPLGKQGTCACSCASQRHAGATECAAKCAEAAKK